MSSIIEDVCRLCASSGYNYHCIFDQTINSIADKIHNCLPIVVDCSDQLPTCICNSCLEALNICDNLRIQCMQADSLLRKRLQVVAKNIKQEKDILNIKSETEFLDTNIEECNVFKEDVNIHQAPNSISEIYEEECHSSDSSAQYIDKDCAEESNVNKNTDDFSNSIEEEVFEDPLKIEGDNHFEFKNIPILIKDASLLRCDICKVIIDNEKLMELHMKFHQSRSMYCSYCKTTFPSPYELYLHKTNDHMIWTKTEMKWFCERCELITAKPNVIGTHVKECKKKLHQCNYCDQVFVYRHQFALHQRTKHYEIMMKDPNVEKFKCEACKREWINKDLYRQHLRTHQVLQDGKYKCPHCEKKFKCNSHLKAHIQGRHENPVKDKIFKCDICSKVFYKKINMTLHKRTHNKLTCKECKKTFDDWKMLDQHLLNDHNTLPPLRNKFVCKYCGSRFYKYKALQDHENLHTGERPYACEICRKTFAAYGSLWTHLKVHAKIEFYCDYCKQKFASKCSLRRHITKHQPSADWQFDCEICNVKFRNSATLEKHLDKNEATHILSCDICKMEFLGMRRWRRHRNVVHDIWNASDCSELVQQIRKSTNFHMHVSEDQHRQVRKKLTHSCKSCGKHFTRLQSLEDHQSFHPDDRPLNCEVCQKNFSNYHTWQVHQRMHSNKSSFSCDYCKKVFQQKYSLKIHIAKHQPPEEWKFSCEVCKIKFWNRHNLESHLKKNRNTHRVTCDICGMIFLEMQKLTKHKHQTHNICIKNDLSEVKKG